jgi:hypothetical protein
MSVGSGLLCLNGALCLLCGYISELSADVHCGESLFGFTSWRVWVVLGS